MDDAFQICTVAVFKDRAKQTPRPIAMRKDDGIYHAAAAWVDIGTRNGGEGTTKDNAKSNVSRPAGGRSVLVQDKHDPMFRNVDCLRDEPICVTQSRMTMKLAGAHN